MTHRARFTVDKNGTETEKRECLHHFDLTCDKQDSRSITELLHEMYGLIRHTIDQKEISIGASITATVAIHPDGPDGIPFANFVKAWFDLLNAEGHVFSTVVLVETMKEEVLN